MLEKGTIYIPVRFRVCAQGCKKQGFLFCLNPIDYNTCFIIYYIILISYDFINKNTVCCSVSILLIKAPVFVFNNPGRTDKLAYVN